MNKLIIILSVSFLTTSCIYETVDSGHQGVEVSYGGKTNMKETYSEGTHVGFHWLYDDMINYDVREKTLVKKFEFNDKNNMSTLVEVSLDYALNKNKVNFIHSGISDIDAKIIKTLQSAAKEVVPQYSAVELNITKRTEAEQKLSSIIAKELPEFYVQFKRVQMTDVDIPKAVAQLAEETAVQLGRNELALKKEAEQTALAKAKVAEAQGNFDAGVLNAKTQKLLSQPALLKLKELEVEMQWAITGVSPYGANNVFGTGSPVLLKNLK